MNPIRSNQQITPDPAPEPAELVVYEDRFSADRGWAWREGDRHFNRDSDTWRSLRRVARCLDDLGIRYAVIGALAMFQHGHRRFTIDVDLIVTADGLATIHARLDDLDLIRPEPARRSVRDRTTGIRFDFHVARTFPGDGQPKPVAFPDPVGFSQAADGITYVDLPTLVELKLASGMTGGMHRIKDFADVVALIKVRSLAADFADQLDSYVRDRYLEIWHDLQEPDPQEGI